MGSVAGASRRVDTVRGREPTSQADATEFPRAGPQVYGIAFCPVEYSEELRGLGFAGKLNSLEGLVVPSWTGSGAPTWLGQA